MNIKNYLTSDQLANFLDYKHVWQKYWEAGTHHWQRIEASRHKLKPVQVDHCIPFTPPYDLEAPCAVLHPSPRFIAELMHGGIHPPLSAVLEQKILLIAKSGESAVVTYQNAPEWRAKNGPIEHECIVDNRRAHLQTEGPLTYEQAIEYTICKDIPVAVWGRQHNQRQFAIVKKSALPDRSTRNSWKLSDMKVAA